MSKSTLSIPLAKAGHFTLDSYGLNAILFYSALVGFGSHLLFLVLFAWLGVRQMALINIGSSLIFLFCFWLVQHGYTHQALLLGATEVIAHALLAVVFVGWESGFHYYILGLVPLVFYSQNLRTSFKSLLAAVLFGLYFAIYVYTRLALPWHSLDPQPIYLLNGLNIATVFFVFAVLSHFYRATAVHAEAALMQANQKLERQAYTDPLTKLLNRRSITAMIARQVELFSRTGQPFSLILGDIDNFKAFNDTFGHPTGDEVLVQVAELLRANVRDQDQVSRWGGEEFLVLLPGTDQAGVLQAAERLRVAIASARMAAGGTESQITMTFGGAAYSGFSAAEECIRRADLAMYTGKRQGKNCVIVSNP